MKRSRSIRHAISVILAALAVAATVDALAADAGALPAVQRSGDVEYVTGGIGSDESAALKAAAARWPLALEFGVQTAPTAQYASDVKVVVHRGGSSGAAVLEATAGGPMLLARLAPGAYTVEATFRGRTQHKAVTVGPGGTARATFLWPADAAGGPAS